MNPKVMKLLWGCGLRPTNVNTETPNWAVLITAPAWRDESFRPIKPSRIAIRNSSRRLSRLKGPAAVRIIMQRFGMKSNIDQVPTHRWTEMYWALEDAAMVKSPS